MGKKSGITNSMLVLFAVLSLFALISSVFAADVAYIYRKNYAIDPRVIQSFQDQGLTIDKIQEDHLPANFASYRLIYIGDEFFHNAAKIPIAKFPTIVSSFYHGPQWGITGPQGVSQLASTSPLHVIKNNQMIQVYTRAQDGQGVGLPYYFLDQQNKIPTFTTVANTETTSSGEKFGDVIAIQRAGAELANHLHSGGNVCFFGITKSKFWTPEAKELFQDCTNFVLATCTSNAQCNPPTTSAPFCQGNDVYVSKSNPFCQNPGSQNSRCVSQDQLQLVQHCAFNCTNGQCGEGNEDIGLIDFPRAVNKIRIETDDATISDSRLQCNQKYKISVTAKNLGQVAENVTFSSTIGTLTFDHLDIKNFAPGDTSLKTKTVNITLAQGWYNITIDAVVDRDIDRNNNQVKRQVFVACSQATILCSSDASCNDQNPLTFDECSNPGTPASQCKNTIIACASNTDCGTSGFIGQEYCVGTSIVKNFQTAICQNPGTKNAACSSSTDPKLIKVCPAACSQGACVVCNTDAQCDDQDSQTRDTCQQPGTPQSYCLHTLPDGRTHDVALVDLPGAVQGIRLENSQGSLITSNQIQCNQNYQIIVQTKNTGSFIENVSYESTFNSLTFQQTPLLNILPGETKEKTKTLNITLPAGNYQLKVLAVLPQDARPADNLAVRDLQVICQQQGGGACTTNTDCGTSGFIGQPSCSGNTIVQQYQTFTCQNPGPSSQCLQQTTQQTLQTCTAGCSNGQCTTPQPQGPPQRLVYGCGILNIPNTIYKLATNIINAPSTCFIITADNVTFNGDDYLVDGDDFHLSTGILALGKDIRITNVTLQDFYYNAVINGTQTQEVSFVNFRSALADGLRVVDSRDLRIHDIITIDNYGNGLTILRSQDLVGRNISAETQTQAGIFVQDSTNINIRESSVRANQDGIVFMNVQNSNLQSISAWWNINAAYRFTDSSRNNLDVSFAQANGYALVITGGQDNIINGDVFLFQKYAGISETNTKNSFFGNIVV